MIAVAASTENAIAQGTDGFHYSNTLQTRRMLGGSAKKHRPQLN
jgi:hypothetical protein